MSELWKFPGPSSTLVQGPTLTILPKRSCSLEFSFELPTGELEEFTVRFSGVEALKCTYLPACSAEMFRTAYAKLVGVENSDWIKDILEIHKDNRDNNSNIKHFMMCFDDGPCYEIISTNFDIGKK